MIPKQHEVEVPLLETLVALGGSAKPRDVYPLLTERFPEITPGDLQIRLKHGEIRWINLIQWTRQRLIESGDMVSPARGIWAISDQGRQRLQDGKAATTPSPAAAHYPVVSLVEIYQRYEEQFRSNLLDKLYQLTPTQFEHFAKELLVAYGFVKVVVTQVGKDGGIDGHGLLRVGLANMAVAFQCKRWADNVSRVEVDKFRGAIQGEYEQGIFFATSGFTKSATAVSIKKGAVPIILLDGESIIDLMIDKEFGVRLMRGIR